MKIIICGNYGATNIGDEAILGGMINICGRAFPGAVIEVLSANPEQTILLHKVPAYYHFPAGFRSFFRNLFNGEMWRTVKAIKNCDLFILGGGGLFTDEKFKAVIIWWIQSIIPVMLGKPFACIGQSVGPLKTSIGRFLTKRVHEKTFLTVVRDNGSKTLLNNIGVDKAIVQADCAFALDMSSLINEKEENYMVFSVRPWIYGESETLHNICARFIDWVHKEFGLVSYLLPLQDIQDDDTDCLKNILRNLKNPEAATLIDFTGSHEKAMKIISRAKVVVGMRLHSLIFSVLCKKPYLAMSYSAKVRQFVQDTDMEDVLMDWNNLDFDEMKERFRKIMEKREEYKTHITGMEIIMREKALDIAPMLVEAYENLKSPKEAPL